MIRFRNPACDLHGMVKIFCALYERLQTRDSFGLDDMTQAIVAANLMSSSGYTGQRALELGASEYRRLDKTYNNSKLFSEWFRLLGWISAVSTTVLEFRFTHLGRHVAAAADAPDALVEECLLGINNPNAVLRGKYTEPVRFFRCLLRTMLHMDGKLCRDEMVLGPMCADDRSEASFAAVLERLQAIRGSRARLDGAFDALCVELHMKAISVRNCTRFPISALRHCGWAEEYRESEVYPGSSMKFFRLTNYGRQRAQELERVTDLRLDDLTRQPEAVQDALMRQGFYQMMARAGFGTTAYTDTPQAADDAARCPMLQAHLPLYCSPYQTMPADRVDAALGVRMQQTAPAPEELWNLFALMDAASTPAALPRRTAAPAAASAPAQPLRLTAALDTAHWDAAAHAAAAELSALLDAGRSPQSCAAVFLERYAQANQAVFYPLVGGLFQILGYRCLVSRPGDNAARWDAILPDDTASVPIEIKSPVEERHLSVKAVRQALENKVLLLSRKPYPTTRDCTTLAVGFLPPRARADVAALMDDIKQTYGITVAVVDFGSLTELAARVLQTQAVPEAGLMQHWEGIIHAGHLTTAASVPDAPSV